ncbi:MAG: DNA cytosine methyltransferase [Acidobacteriota bacterium]
MTGDPPLPKAATGEPFRAEPSRAVEPSRVVAPSRVVDPFRVVELYCGIGGCAVALEAFTPGPVAETVAAVDIHRGALAVYAHNFPHPTVASLVEAVSAERLHSWDAHLWWLSPPCQPFTQRGRQRDADDPRAATFLAAIDRIAAVRPRYVALENVPPFEGSRVHQRLIATLEAAGYAHRHERLICPSDFGIPNRRRRYYLLAGRRPLLPIPPIERQPQPLANFLDPEPDPTLEVDAAFVERYRPGLRLVRAEDPQAVTECFTSAYGRSHVRSGSYLEAGDGEATCVRRFSPTEMLRLLGFPTTYRLPPDLPPKRAWPLVGNSLSILPVRSVLASIPELATQRDQT